MRTHDRIYVVFALLCAVVLFFSGCAATFYREKDGVSFFRITLGTDQQIGPVDLAGVNSKLKVGGVKSEQSVAAGTITSAAIQAVKPHVLP